MTSHQGNSNQVNEADIGREPESGRVLRSGSKRKEQRDDTYLVVAEQLDRSDGQENYPKSIEKQRYLVVEPHSPFHSVLDRSYHKIDPSWEGPNEQALQIDFPNSYEKDSQSSSKIVKKCVEAIFNPYDSSFEDRISVQTMDSKQFSSSFELEDREIDKSSEGRRENRLTLGGAKNKDYFDNYIIEDEEENEEEKRTEANGEDNSSQHSFPKIQVQRDNSETRYDQSGNNSEQKEKSLSGLDITELKLIEKKKIAEKNEIEAAIKQTGDQNDLLKQRIRELEKEINNTFEENKKYQQMMTEYGIKLNTARFDDSVRHLRKYSL